MTAQGADDEPTALNGLAKCLQFPRIREERRRLTMGVARIGAAADLDRLDAQRLQVVERFLERLVAEQHRKYANLHTLTQVREAAARSIASNTR